MDKIKKAFWWDHALNGCWNIENIKTIELVFPVTGHSFMPAYRQWGIAENKLCKMDMIHDECNSDQIKDISGEI